MLTFFKPNKANKGHMLAFNVGDDKLPSGRTEKCVFAQVVKQSGWNEETGNGSFKDGEKISVKFSEFEVAAMLNALETDFAQPVKFFHKSGKGSTQIFFSKTELQGKELRSFAVVKDGVRFGVTLSATETTNELVILREFFKYALTEVFNSRKFTKTDL